MRTIEQQDTLIAECEELMRQIERSRHVQAMSSFKRMYREFVRARDNDYIYALSEDWCQTVLRVQRDLLEGQ